MLFHLILLHFILFSWLLSFGLFRVVFYCFCMMGVVCVYVCVCMYGRMYVYVCVHVCVVWLCGFVYVGCVCMFVYVCTGVGVYVCVYVWMLGFVLFALLCTLVCVYVWLCFLLLFISIYFIQIA